MRSVCASIAIAVVLIAGAITYSFALTKTSDALCAQIQEIKQNALQEDWPAVQEKLDQFDKSFHKKAKWLCALVHHHDIDVIETTLQRMVQYANFEENTDFLAELDTLSILLEHLSSKAKPTLENLL